MARPRTKHFVPYSYAVAIVREAGVRTRKKYWDWHTENHPNYLPRHPHNHYREWTSWNAFLGTNNSFNKFSKGMRKKANVDGGWRPYWEAVRWAQLFAKQHEITTAAEWKKRYPELNVPKDSPQYPYQVYDEFQWKIWLGKNLKAKLANATSDIGVIAFHHVTGMPNNVIRMKVWKDGYHSMLTKIEEQGLDVPAARCIWIFSQEAVKAAEEALQEYGNQRGNDYIIPNANLLLWGMVDQELYIIKHT